MPKSAQKIKKPPVYKADGLLFKTKPLMDFYLELKELKKQKIVESFTLPTIEAQRAKSKFGAKKCEVDGEKFDSVMEAKFYVHLKKLQLQQIVKAFTIHPVYPLQESFKKNGKTIRAIAYISDFYVTYADGTEIVYDVKGRETADFKLKKKMFDHKYRELTLKCVQYRAKEKEWIDIHGGKRESE